MRPPVRWIRRAEKSIWPAAMTWRVKTRPGWKMASATGRDAIAPPRTSAAHTCMCVWLTAPSHVRGEIVSAATTPATHWASMRPAKR